MFTPEMASRLIASSFQLCFSRFLSITQGARKRFEEADWIAVQVASRERLRIYDGSVAQLVSKLRKHPETADIEFWQACRRSFLPLAMDLEAGDIAQSFFNSTFGKVFGHEHIDNTTAFVIPSQLQGVAEPPVRELPLGEDPQQALQQLLSQSGFSLPFVDIQDQVDSIQQALDAESPQWRQPDSSIEMLVPIFFRNKGAYLVGKLYTREGVRPLVLAILNDNQGSLYVDTVLIQADLLSILFGFARSYFMVNIPCPSSIVGFLRDLMPHKSDAELYTAIGCLKHAKTQFYLQFIDHLQQSTDQFIPAPGIPGLVMTVFTLPSYHVVFKVIRDKFGPSKTVSRQQVIERYRLVKQHDLIGRMADTQDFSNFVFPRDRFDPELLGELQRSVGDSIQLTEQHVIIRHLYIERRMIPLNLYLDQADDIQARHALSEYGQAIKEMAAANIFPGDMLLKNFGITRHGRVIFYDYDEVTYLIDCNFREIPEPLYPEQEMQAEPWYSVAENDVFPEEFSTFLVTHPQHKRLLHQLHPELFSARYWQQLQKQIYRGEFADLYPYPHYFRFCNRFGQAHHPAPIQQSRELSPP